MVDLRKWLLLPMLLLSCYPLAAQQLEELLDERAAEEEDIRNVPGADLESLGQAPLTGHLRLPTGEQVQRLRLSQDREVDPESYIVGPGDVIQLYVWGEFDLSYMLQVDPEGQVVIPTIGSYAISGMTLAAAKSFLLENGRLKYPGVEITVTLASMRYFTVYTTGAVLIEGSQIVHPATRVDDVIEKAGGYVDDLRGASVEEEIGGKKVTRVRQFQRQPVSRRAIQVIHCDKSVEEVDLDLFHATGNLKYNPYVHMGDVIHVRYRRDEIFAYGAVHEPGGQEFRSGDTVGTLLTLAGGLDADAPLDEVRLWRFLPDGSTSRVIDLIEKGSGVTQLDDIADVPLQAQDMLFVRARSDWQQTPTVHIHGAVRYQGRYRIRLGETTLRDIVTQAGGFTAQASLVNATVIRMKSRSRPDPELARLSVLQRVSGLADMTPEDRAYLKTKARQSKGVLAVDFVRLFTDSDDENNILLEGGDVVFVPERRRTVSISGMVTQPGLVAFVPGRTVREYLSQAGGYAWRANKRGARLIRARTGLRENLSNNLVPEPGDEIWIPEKEYHDWWAFVQSTMRTVSETLTLAILIRTL